MVLQTDFFRNNFRRTNNLLRYFSIDKRKRLWGHKYCYCYRGRGSSAVPWRANTGEGWGGKMKLRLVKFLTSSENEIERKEEGEGGGPASRVLPSPSQPATIAPLPLSPLPFIIPFSLSLRPAPPARIAPLQFLLRHVSGKQYPPAIPPPAVLLLPSFFINYRSRRVWREGPWQGAQLADPAVLSNDNTARAQLARHPCLLTQIGWPAASLRF